MTILSHQDALNQIAQRITDGNPMSTQELIDLAKNDLDVSVDGAKVKLGYSGSLTTSGNLYSGSLGLGIKSAFGADVGILDQTDFFTFINDRLGIIGQTFKRDSVRLCGIRLFPSPINPA